MSLASRLQRRTYSFDEVYEWSTNISQRRNLKSSIPMVKVLTIGSIILILGVILWVVFNSKKKKKQGIGIDIGSDGENEYVCLETGVTITLDELKSGEYEVVSE